MHAVAFLPEVGQVLDQCAAPKYVQQLGAAANAEHRDAPTNCGSCQGQFEIVAFPRTRSGRSSWLLAVKFRRDIFAPGQQESVESSSHRDRVHIERQMDWQAAGSGNARCIFAEIDIKRGIGETGRCANLQPGTPPPGKAYQGKVAAQGIRLSCWRGRV